MPRPVSRKDFRLERTAGQPCWMPFAIPLPASSSSWVTVSRSHRRTLTPPPAAQPKGRRSPPGRGLQARSMTQPQTRWMQIVVTPPDAKRARQLRRPYSSISGISPASLAAIFAIKCHSIASSSQSAFAVGSDVALARCSQTSALVRYISVRLSDDIGDAVRRGIQRLAHGDLDRAGALFRRLGIGVPLPSRQGSLQGRGYLSNELT